jgi:hypothetical protein
VPAAHPMQNIGYTGPDLSSPAMLKAFVAATDGALAAHRDATMPAHFTRSAFYRWPEAYRALKKCLPSNAYRLRKLILRYGPQAAEPLVLTGHLRNEVLRGPIRFSSRGTTRSIVWPNAPRYVYRIPKNSTFDKAAAVLATNPTDKAAITARIDAAMQRYFDSVGATPASPSSPSLAAAPSA